MDKINNMYKVEKNYRQTEKLCYNISDIKKYGGTHMAEKKYVYMFSEGNGSMRELLGGKGANMLSTKVLTSWVWSMSS